MLIKGTEDNNHNPILHITSYLLLCKRLFLCHGVQVVLDYKFCLLLTIAILGAFFASSDFLVYTLLWHKLKSNSFPDQFDK